MLAQFQNPTMLAQFQIRNILCITNFVVSLFKKISESFDMENVTKELFKKNFLHTTAERVDSSRSLEQFRVWLTKEMNQSSSVGLLESFHLLSIRLLRLIRVEPGNILRCLIKTP